MERASSYLLFKALAEGRWTICQSKIIEHLEWKPLDAKDQRGMYEEQK